MGNRWQKGSSCPLELSPAHAVSILPVRRANKAIHHPIVQFTRRDATLKPLSVRKSLTRKKILLIGCTGFIGKVWLTMLAEGFARNRPHLPADPASWNTVRRCNDLKKLSPSLLLSSLSMNYMAIGWVSFLPNGLRLSREMFQSPSSALTPQTARRLYAELDLIVNSAGLTDFNPDLRLALSTNADSVLHLIEFLNNSQKAGLVHVSTCFVNGRTDGRVPEELRRNYTPKGRAEFDATSEWKFLHQEIRRVEEESENSSLNEQFRIQVVSRWKDGQEAGLGQKGIQNRIRNLRTRWVRDQLIELGVQRAQYWGWPNIYTFTKSLGESFWKSKEPAFPLVSLAPR